MDWVEVQRKNLRPYEEHSIHVGRRAWRRRADAVTRSDDGQRAACRPCSPVALLLLVALLVLVALRTLFRWTA